MSTTNIKAKKDLYNKGKCFTKDHVYEVNGRITMTASLMEKIVTNDLGERQFIGNWWRDFEIVEEMEDHGEALDYERVLPRDLFNEAKLLKCMGALCLRIHDGITPVHISMEEMDGAFDIGLMEDGYLTIKNLHINILGVEYLFRTQYNSKSNYPLFVTHDNCDYTVFDEEGEYDAEFIHFCKEVIK